jgi:hypothetical protein
LQTTSTITLVPASLTFGSPQSPLSAGAAGLSSSPTQVLTVAVPMPAATVVIRQ